MKHSNFSLLVLAIALSFVGWPSSRAQAANDDTKEGVASPISFYGPGMHFAGGIRMMKAPDLDTFDGVTAGIKISPVSIAFGGGMTYLSILAPGINWVGGNKAALSLSPFIVSHASGLGLSFDLYTVSNNSNGGPFGVGLNLDIMGLSRFIASMTGK